MYHVYEYANNLFLFLSSTFILINRAAFVWP